MTTSLTTFAGANYTVPLIPSAHEPAFCTASTSSNIFVYNHNHQLMAQVAIAGGEFYNSGSWSSNWSGQPSSNSSWQYAGTSMAGPHGHFYISYNPGFDTSNRSTVYYTQGYQTGTNYLYGGTNSRCTGVWANKTKRDGLCLQRPNNVATNLYRTQVSYLGYGALMNPLTSTGAMTGQTPGTANGYNTNQSFGLVGYNETSQMWVVGQPVSGATCEMFVYKNIQAPTITTCMDNSFWNQFNHGAKLTVSVSLPNSSSYDAAQWKIIPLNNGNIAVICKYEGNYLRYLLFTGNNGVNSTSWTQSTVQDISTTTSYNNDLWTDNLVALTTYDGKYTYVFTQYYYYLSGNIGFCIRHSDGQRRVIQNTDTSNALAPVMIGANNMIMGYGSNSDGGSGQLLYCYNWDYLFSRYATDGTDVTSYYVTTRIDNPSASTTYPMIWTVPSPFPRFIKGVI